MDRLIDRVGRLDVVVVDDSRCMRDLLSLVLRDLGVGRTRAHGDAVSALQEMRRAPPDLVVTDWVMAPLDGLDLVRTLRAAPDPMLRRVPVLMVTAHTEQWRINAARDAGVTEFLAKPISVRLLAERLAAIVERPRPFVRAARYTGPCRRRRADGYPGPERREAPAKVALGRAEVAGLLRGRLP